MEGSSRGDVELEQELYELAEPWSSRSQQSPRRDHLPWPPDSHGISRACSGVDFVHEQEAVAAGAWHSLRVTAALCPRGAVPSGTLPGGQPQSGVLRLLGTAEEAAQSRAAAGGCRGALRWVHSTIWCPAVGHHSGQGAELSLSISTAPPLLPRRDPVALKPSALPLQMLRIPPLLPTQRRSWRGS